MKKPIHIDFVYYEMLLEIAKKSKPSALKPEQFVENMIKTIYIKGVGK